MVMMVDEGGGVVKSVDSAERIWCEVIFLEQYSPLDRVHAILAAVGSQIGPIHWRVSNPLNAPKPARFETLAP